MKRFFSIIVILLVVAVTGLFDFGYCGSKEEAQALYLKASKLIREENYADAKALLERILEDYPGEEVAIKADEKLSEISDKADQQKKERTFYEGPGLYVTYLSGKVEALKAYKITKNDVASETGNPKYGIIRALSQNTPYHKFVLSDIDKIQLFTSASDMSVFRLERTEEWFAYHRVEDKGVVNYTKVDEDVYNLDLSSLDAYRPDQKYYRLGGIGRRKKGILSILAEQCRGGLSAPLDMGFDASFVSQKVGTWGGNPGPFTRIIWTWEIINNYREILWDKAPGTYQGGIKLAKEYTAEHPNDPSIEWFIAEQYELMGDCENYINWSNKQLEKAKTLSVESQIEIATKNVKWGQAIKRMAVMVKNIETLEPTEENIFNLEMWIDEFNSHLAYYLLSIIKGKQGEYELAEKFAKKAEKKVQKDDPLMSYAGLVGDEVILLKDAQKAAKKIYKAHKDEMKRLRK